MTLDDLLRSILNPNPGGNQLAQAGAGYLPQTGLAPDQVARFHQMSGLGSPQAAPQASAAPQMAPSAAPMPQAAVAAPQAAPQGNEGGFLSRLFGGRQDINPALNETASWLERQGYDPGTARALAGNKEAMQRILVGQVGSNQREKPIEINGRLVDPKDYHVIADFSDKSGGEKLPTSYQEFELAKQDGFKGTYTDWQTKSVREQDPTFGREVQLRQEYEGLPPVKTYQIVRDNYERIRQGVAQGTGAGDLAIVFGYMKMLDPTSVVREGEQAAATDVSGVPSKVLNLYNSVVAGAKLPPEARTELLGAATQVYKQAAENVGDVNKRYSAIASNYQLDPSRIVQMPEEYPGSLLVGAPPAPASPPPGINPNILQPAPAQPAPDDWREVAPGVRLRKVN